jgi:23S rRNA pseudouridine2605 synthase
MSDQSSLPKGDRIAKVMARAGLCSRREAERWIADSRVKVGGKILTTPAHTVTSKSKILVDGKPLPDAEPARLWRYHKPTGQVTSHSDPEGRDTVFDKLPKDLPRVISVGRLDYNSMTANWRGNWNCQRQPGHGATGCGCMAMSTKPGWKN